MQTKKEELWNAASHATGILLSIIGFIILLLKDSEKTTFSTLSIIIYSISLIVLYTASTIYHSIVDEKRKITWRKIDHISIYVLIAGTYTPVSLITLEDSSGWLLFIIIWSIAVIGTILKIFFTGKYETISLILYLIMGWLIIFDINNLIASIAPNNLNFLMLGGLFYTIGIIFMLLKKYHIIMLFGIFLF